MMLTGFFTRGMEIITQILISCCFVPHCNISSVQWDASPQALEQEYYSGSKGMYDFMELF